MRTGCNHIAPKGLLLLTAASLGLFALTAFAQERVGNMVLYRSQQGLSQGLLSGICQSRDGYIYIGSENGLYRFDGYRYQRIVAGPGSITDNLVTDVAEAADGSIWVAGLTKGVSRFDPFTQSFRQYPRLWNAPTPWQGVKRIHTRANGDVWLATAGMGLGLYIRNTDSFAFFLPASPSGSTVKSETSTTFTDIAEDPLQPGVLWLTAFDAVYSFNCSNSRFERHPTPISTTNAPAWQCLDTDGKGGLWLGSWGGGLWHYNPAGQRLSEIRATPGKKKSGIIASDVLRLNDSTVWWACSDYGLLELHVTTGKMSSVGPALRVDSTQKHNYVFTRISKTATAGVMVSMRGNYLQALPAYARLGRMVTPLWQKRFDGVIVSSLIHQPAQHRYLLGCAGPVQLLALDASLQSWYPIPVEHPGSQKGINGLFSQPDGSVLGLGYDGLLYTLPPGGTTMKLLPNQPMRGAGINDLCADAGGNMWMLTGDKLFRLPSVYSAPTDSFVLRSPLTDSLKVQPFFYTLLCDSKGNAWVSSSQGLWNCAPDAKQAVHFHPAAKKSEPLSSNLVKCMTIDSRDRLWLGYNGEGLQVFDTRTGLVTITFSGNEFASTVINDLNQLPDGRMLAETPEGLCAINPSTLQWQIYDRLDGLFQTDLDGGMHTSPDGLVVINHYANFNVFRAEELNLPGLPLRLHITEASFNNEMAATALFASDTVQLELPAGKNNIRLLFAALHPAYPMRTRYYFSLDAASPAAGWQLLSEPVLQLTALRPGTYHLRLKARGAGDSESQVKHLVITIMAPVWQRWWFRLLVVALLLASVYALYRFRINQLKRTLALRNTISANLHDDIGASLSNIQILNEMARRNLAKPEAARQYLERSGEDIQQVSEALSDIVWNVNPRYDNLDQLFIRMKRYAAELLDARNITYELHFPDSAAGIHMHMDQRRDFYLIFKESLNNVVKHSGAARVQLAVTIVDQRLNMDVQDNGTGFDMLTLRGGNGLQNMKQRAEKWKGEISMESTPGHGTRLTLHMPLA
jgi:signal transduction histidine kinase/ligand-binding sensor domain-containing protein